MGLAIEGVRYLFAAYILGISAYSLYMLYLTNKTEFINNDTLLKEPMGKELLWNLRAMRTTSLNTSITLVIINFGLIVYLIFSKFRIGTRF